MKMIKNNLLYMAAIVAILASILPAMASLDIEGSFFEAEVLSGDSLIHNINVTLLNANSSKNMSVDILGYGQKLDGAVIGLEEPDDNSPYSARSFVKASPERFELQPGIPQEIVLDINVPTDIVSGSRYALAFIHTDPEGDGQVKIVTGVNVPVILNIEGSEKDIKGEVETLEAEKSVSPEMLNASLVFKNTGDTRYNIQVEGLLENEESEVLAEDSESTLIPILPTFSREIKLKFNLNSELTSGTHVIKVTIKHEDGTEIASKEVELNV